MDPYAIHSVKVMDVSGLDANLQPTITKQVTFQVGTHGPFILRYKHGEYTADKVTQDMEAQVTILRAIPGATPAAR